MKRSFGAAIRPAAVLGNTRIQKTINPHSPVMPPHSTLRDVAGEGSRSNLAVGEADFPSHFSRRTNRNGERECQQNDNLADSYRHRPGLQ